MRETDSEHVPKIGQSHKSWQAASTRAVAENIAEEQTSDDDIRGGKIGFGDRGEVGNVAEDVENRHPTNSNRHRDFKRFLRILGLAANVVCVLPAIFQSS